MFYYYNYGYSISSDIKLPLNSSDCFMSKKKIEIKKLKNTRKRDNLIFYTVNITQTKKLLCSVNENDNNLSIDFEHYVLFEFSKSDDHILFLYYFYDDYPQEWKERLISRFGFSYLLSWLGMTVLHGSAISDREKTVCMVADSNSGKSSLAGLFISEGNYIVGDELVVLSKEQDRFMVYNSSDYLYLSEHSIKKTLLEDCSIENVGFSFKNDYMDLSENKKRVKLNSNVDNFPRVCKKIVCLIRQENTEVWIRTLNKANKFMCLLRYIYAPIVFPFMRKNLFDGIDFLLVQELYYKDCFEQFDLIKTKLEIY